jgi:hypothetical protein
VCGEKPLPEVSVLQCSLSIGNSKTSRLPEPDVRFSSLQIVAGTLTGSLTDPIILELVVLCSFLKRFLV